MGGLILVFDGFPQILGWELTLECNLRCKHCASSAGRRRQGELTTKEAIDICDQFPALLVREVDFTGGEPLLRPDWQDIALHLRDLGIKTKMITNGVALTKGDVEKIKEVGIAGVGMSLDGLEETHDHIRGRPGLFRQVFKSAELLLEAGIPLTIITAVNSLNIRELESVMELLRSKGIMRWRVQPTVPFGRVKDSRELEMDEEVYLQLESFIHRWGPKHGEIGLELVCSDGIGYYYEADPARQPWHGCSAGLISCGITSDGKVKGCLSMPDDLIEGDLRKNDLWDIWFHPESFSYTRQFAKEKIGSNCRLCSRIEECKGGCSSKSYALTGQFHNDPYCFHGIDMRGQKLIVK